MPEGGPTDSETLTQVLHSHGINIRYLGLILKKTRVLVSENASKSKNLEFLLEKEIFLRSFKHLIIKIC